MITTILKNEVRLVCPDQPYSMVIRARKAQSTIALYGILCLVWWGE